MGKFEPCQRCGIWPSIVDDPISRRARPAPSPSPPAPRRHHHRSPRSSELHRRPEPESANNNSTKKKWRRRPAGGAPPRRLNQMARVGLLTDIELAGRLARARGVQLTSTLQCARCGATARTLQMSARCDSTASAGPKAITLRRLRPAVGDHPVARPAPPGRRRIAQKENPARRSAPTAPTD